MGVGVPRNIGNLIHNQDEKIEYLEIHRAPVGRCHLPSLSHQNRWVMDYLGCSISYAGRYPLQETCDNIKYRSTDKIIKAVKGQCMKLHVCFSFFPIKSLRDLWPV